MSPTVCWWELLIRSIQARARHPCLKFPPQFCLAKWPTNAQPIGPDGTFLPQLSSLYFARPCSFSPFYVLHNDTTHAPKGVQGNPFIPLIVNVDIRSLASLFSFPSFQTINRLELWGLLVTGHVGEAAADEPPVPVVDGRAHRRADLLQGEIMRHTHTCVFVVQHDLQHILINNL